MRAAQLGDEVYLSVHDFDTDRPLLRLPILRAIMTGGLLAELVLAEKATVCDTRLTITDAQPSTDPLIHRALAEILSDSPHERELGYWLGALGQQSVDWIAARLLGAGILAPTSAHRRHRDIGLGHAPTRQGAGRWPAARVAHAITEAAVLNDHDRCLAALLHAAGLSALIAPGASDGDRSAPLERQLAMLPAALSAIVREVTTALTELAGG